MQQKNNALESMRGIAALGTALYHTVFLASPRSNLQANAELFVDFFFVLSGFVLTLAYARKVEQGQQFRVFAFLRLARLMPLHMFVMALWAAWVLLGPAGAETETNTTLRFFLNLFLLNAVGLMPELSWNYPAWSIGAELVAYTVFWAVFAWFGRGMSAGRALLISAVAYGVLIANSGDTILATFDLGALRCIGGFFLGVAVFYVGRSAHTTRLSGTAGEAAVLAAAIALLSCAPGLLWTELATIGSFAAIVLVFSGSNGAVTNLLNAPVLVFLGRISYSVYLLHALAFDAMFHIWSGPMVFVENPHGGGRYFYATTWAPLMNLAVLGVVILGAAATWRWIEEPARKASKAWIESRSQRVPRRASEAPLQANA